MTHRANVDFGQGSTDLACGPESVRLGDDTHRIARVVDHDDRTDTRAEEPVDRIGDGRIHRNRDHVGGHQLVDLHSSHYCTDSHSSLGQSGTD